VSSSIYLVLPDWHGDIEDVHDSVVDALLHGPRYIRVALELWRLAGQDERAAKIKAVLERAYQNDNTGFSPILNTTDIKEFYDLLDGLDDALKATWLNDKWQVFPELMPEVRRRTTTLDLDDLQGHLASEGVSEGLGDVHSLRDFLKQALDQNLHVALD
jgi:hypothetical protein